MSRLPLLITFLTLVSIWQPSLSGQSEDFIDTTTTESFGNAILSESTSDETDSLLGQPLPSLIKGQTISETANVSQSSTSVNLAPEEEHSNLLKQLSDELDAEKIRSTQNSAPKDLLTFTILSFITDAVVTFIALAIILNLLETNTLYSPLAVLAGVAAGVAAIIGYILGALPPNPIGIGISAILLILMLSMLRDIKASAATCAGLFAKIISVFFVWLASLGADALF